MQRTRHHVAEVTTRELIVKASELRSGDEIDNDPNRDGRYPSYSIAHTISQVWVNGTIDPTRTMIMFFGYTQIVPADREYHVTRTTITYVPFIGPLLPASRIPMKMSTTHQEYRMIYRGSIQAAHGGMVLRAHPCPCPRCYDLHPDNRQHLVATLDTGYIVAHAHRDSFTAELVTLDEWGERPQPNPEAVARELRQKLTA